MFSNVSWLAPGLIGVIIVIVLLQAIIDGAGAAWGTWAFKRDEQGRFSFAQRISQSLCVLLGILAFAAFIYSFLIRR